MFERLFIIKIYSSAYLHFLLGGILLHNQYFFFYSALSEEEKTTLRAGLITNFNEPINQVSEKNEC